MTIAELFPSISADRRAEIDADMAVFAELVPMLGRRAVRVTAHRMRDAYIVRLPDGERVVIAREEVEAIGGLEAAIEKRGRATRRSRIRRVARASKARRGWR